MTKWLVLVLKDDSMVQHHMGPNQMHPDRSSCLGLSVNGWMSQDQMFCTFSEHMLRNVYCTVHALGHPYLEPSNRTMQITKQGSNTVVTLVAGRVDSRWFKSILPVAFEEKGLFQCYFFSFPYKELTATMQGCNYHWRLSNSFSQTGRAGGFTLVLANLTGSFWRKGFFSV